MWPEVTVGGASVSTYALTYGFAIVVAGMVALHRLDDLGLPRHRSLPAMAATFAAGLVGSVALWKLMGWIASRAERPDWFSAEGSTMLGVVVIGLPAAALTFRLAGAPVAASLDALTSSLPLGQAIGRLGCLLAGCCAGRPTASWIAMKLPDGPHHWCPRYPTQLIAAGIDLALFALLSVVYTKLGAASRTGRGRLRPGELTALFLLLYGGKRFALEFIRLNRPVLGPFTWAHLISVVLILTSIAMVFIIRRSPRQTRNGAGSDLR